jgi:hypothetical protein
MQFRTEELEQQEPPRSSKNHVSKPSSPELAWREYLHRRIKLDGNLVPILSNEESRMGL